MLKNKLLTAPAGKAGDGWMWIILVGYNEVPSSSSL
jgi:hypothetical protein